MKFIEVKGDSMNPTLGQGQILIKKNTSKINKLKYNDLVIFNYNNKQMIKRIVGFPEDTISIQDDLIFVNGKQIFKYIIFKKQYYECDLAPGTSFMIGDNPNNSLDSRKIGPIPTDSITGKIIFRIWPPRLF